MRRVVTVSLAALLLAGCQPTPSPDTVSYGPEVPADTVEGTRSAAIRGLDRLGKGGPMIAGTVERFRIELDAAEGSIVRWSANAGAVWSDGGLVHWTLPPLDEGALTAEVITKDGERLEGTFTFDIALDPEDAEMEWAVNVAADGQIDPTPDVLERCNLQIGAGDVPHVVYYNDTHAQLWYGFFDGATWQLELVDGPGFDVGGSVHQLSDFVLDAAGNPHIAYYIVDSPSYQLRYATKIGGSWVREQANTSVNVHVGAIAIDLDPSQANRPTIFFTRQNNSDEDPAVAYRTATNSWTVDTNALGANFFDALGGARFDGAGTLWTVFGQYLPQVVTWSATASWGTPETLAGTSGSNVEGRVELDSVGQPIVMLSTGMHHRVGGSWIRSAYESFDAAYFDLAVDNAALPVFAVRHGVHVEIGELNSESYWLYSEVDDSDADVPSVQVDSSNITHVCYTKDDQIWFD